MKNTSDASDKDKEWKSKREQTRSDHGRVFVTPAF